MIIEDNITTGIVTHVMHRPASSSSSFFFFFFFFFFDFSATGFRIEALGVWCQFWVVGTEATTTHSRRRFREHISGESSFFFRNSGPSSPSTSLKYCKFISIGRNVIEQAT